MANYHYNPERRAWRGRSYKKGGNIRALREAEAAAADAVGAKELPEPDPAPVSSAGGSNSEQPA
jgi:hypothetical protein